MECNARASEGYANMPLNLPPPDKRQLKRSPLVLVVAQVRHEEITDLGTGRAMLEIHKALGGPSGLYPRSEQATEQATNIQVMPGLVPTALQTQRKGWRLRSADGAWIISLMPEFFSLETTAYTTWGGDFRPRFSTLLDAVTSAIKPATQQRIGLRYIDRISDPVVQSPQEWRDYIAPEFLGPLLHPLLGPAALATHQQIDLEAGDDMHSSIRHGFFADPSRANALTYLLDFDVYQEVIRAFDKESIMAALDGLNLLALQLFQQAVTERLLDHLGRSES
jgi:uncharacterized protein (TIGR04255 family)